VIDGVIDAARVAVERRTATADAAATVRAHAWS
jgi:hypothetical protein